MVFTKRLREGVRRGRIRCSVRIWQRCHVKVGGRYPMDEGHIVIDSIETIERADVTDALARESGFADAEDLLQTASHGPGQTVYLIRFHYLPPGAWDVPSAEAVRPDDSMALLQRIRRSKPPQLRERQSAKRRSTR
jgi:hypothetical protein